MGCLRCRSWIDLGGSPCRVLTGSEEFVTDRINVQLIVRGLFGGVLLLQPRDEGDALVLHLLGHRNVAVYDGGLIEWCADRDLPLDRGE